MKDRIPTYPGRVKMTLPDGSVQYVTLERADQPTQVGTPLNKATLLSDDTAELLGLTGDPTINEAFEATLALGGTVTLKEIWTSPPPKKVSNPSQLHSSRYGVANSNVSGYVIFAGGYSRSAVVDAYSEDLTRVTVTSLSVGRQSLGAASVGRYAIFAGGLISGTDGSNAVDSYDETLTRTVLNNLPRKLRGIAGASIHDYALFGGGAYYFTSSQPTVIDDSVFAYNSNLTMTTIEDLSEARFNLSAINVGEYALFFGGTYSISGGSHASKVVDAYNTDLTHTIPESLTVEGNSLASASFGDLAVIALINAGLDTYDYSLTKQSFSDLTNHQGNAAENGGYIIFGGYQYVFVYDRDLTCRPIQNLSTTRSNVSAGSVGNYILFAGGSDGGSSSAIVDAYQIEYTTTITIPAFSKYRFDGIHNDEQFTELEKEWSSTGKLSGYIKRGGFTLTGLVSST